MQEAAAPQAVPAAAGGCVQEPVVGSQTPATWQAPRVVQAAIRAPLQQIESSYAWSFWAGAGTVEQTPPPQTAWRHGAEGQASPQAPQLETVRNSTQEPAQRTCPVRHPPGMPLPLPARTHFPA
jgi:hypothetical protein